MGNVYFVVPDLDYAGHARQVSLLAPALRCADWSVAVYSLAGHGPFGSPLRAASVAVELQLGRSARDARSWLIMRCMIPRHGHGAVHAFGLGVLRRIRLATVGMRRPRIVLSLTGRERFTWLDRRCLNIVSQVLVPHGTAADALTRQGVPSQLVTAIPYAVAPGVPATDRAELCRTLGLPPTAKLIVTSGRMDTRTFLFDAVWAFEFIRFVDEDVRLLVIGDGPHRERLEKNARALAPEGSRVHFLGSRSDVLELLALADLVVLPHLAGGVNIALEAMAAGRAVVAAQTPDLSAVIRHGETGLLALAHQPRELARAMHRLLLDPDLRDRLGISARQFVLDRQSLDRVVPALEALYEQ